MWMLILDALMRENDRVSFQMFPEIDCEGLKSLNLSVIQNPIATFCQKNLEFRSASRLFVPSL